ncbi:MAG: hypothetical protein IT329_22790 [Caldilineaceae bacterium]|nr:hypothetical protein [Caldilineaceae bacterium]
MTKPAQAFSLVATTLLVLAAVAVLLIPMRIPFNFYDEGLAVFNAARVMGGEVPYRDFWAIYPPGQFYTLAGLFKVFGTSLLVSRVYDTLVRLTIALAIWLIARKTTARPLAYLAFAVAVLLLASAGFYAYAVFPALALGLLSIVSLLAYTGTGRRSWLFVSGLLVGLSMFIRWDIGAYAGVSIAAALLLFRLLRVEPGSTLAARALAAVGEIAILTAAALAVVVVSYGAVGVASGFGNLWEQVIAVPTSLQHEVRWLPYPDVWPPPEDTESLAFWDWLHFYTPLLIYATAVIVYAAFIVTKRAAFDTRFAGRVAVTVLGVLLFAQALSRYDYIHVIPTSIPASLVAITLLSPDVVAFINRFVRPAYIILIVAFVLLYIVSPVRLLQKTWRDFPPSACYSHIERASCVPLNPDQAQAVNYLRTHAQEGESIFVGNQRHDLVFVSDVGFYFLSAHPSASRYSELFPGVATTLPVQQTIIQELGSKKVKWVVLVNIWLSQEPNASAESSGIVELDQFIRSNYRNVAEFGAYQIWEAASTSGSG